MNRIFLLTIALAGGLLSCPAQAQVHAVPTSADLAAAFFTVQPVPAADSSWTMATAYAVQAGLVAHLADTLGPPAGFKVGLTSAATQARFGVPHPVYGVLFTPMLYPSGTAFPTHMGVRWLAEGDLVVRVADAAIHTAQTRLEVLQYLDAVLPFLELPDLLYAPTVPLNGPALAAVNVGARAGVLGEAVALEATEAWVQRLETFEVTLRDGNGTVLSEGRGADLMGHPLDVVRWLCEALQQTDLRLKAGDLISLGSLTRLVPITAGTTLRVQYKGLNPASDVPMEIQASFYAPD